MSQLVIRYWYVPVITIIVLYGYFTILNLRAENERLSFQVAAYELKDKNNQAKIDEADAARAEAEQRHYETEKLIGIIRNDTTNGELAPVLANVLKRVQQR